MTEPVGVPDEAISLEQGQAEQEESDAEKQDERGKVTGPGLSQLREEHGTAMTITRLALTGLRKMPSPTA